MNDNEIFRLDIHQILRSKAPASYKKIPRFAISLLAKLICQKELNNCLEQNDNLTGVDFMENTIQNFNLTIHLEGEENIPDFDRKCIFVSNHPLAGLDGICLAAILGKKYDKHILYLVNDILYFIKPLQNIFIPVNKHGSQAKDAVFALNEALSSENQIITFPAGLCSRKTKGVIQDPEWKKMFITKAVEYKRDIVPVYFDGKNSNFFYNLANFRKQLGIKFNIEMLFLPKELFKACHSTFTIYFGKPIPWQTFDSSQTPQQWANEVRTCVYNCKGNVFIQNKYERNNP
jgi:1-acyl-sn-glycerol-3-phosphate acyltransferase